MLGGGGDRARPGEAADRPAESRRREHGLSVAVETVTLDIVVPGLTEFPTRSRCKPARRQTLLFRAGRRGLRWEAEVDDEAVVEASMKFEGADEAAVGARTFSENELLTLRGLRRGHDNVSISFSDERGRKASTPKAAHTLAVNVAATEATERGGTQ